MVRVSAAENTPLSNASAAEKPPRVTKPSRTKLAAETAVSNAAASLFDPLPPGETALPAAGANLPSPSAGPRIADIQPVEIVCPVSGEIVDVSDKDAMIDLYERIDRADKQNYAIKSQVKQLLADMTEGDAKTRRVIGRTRAAVITFPSDSYEQKLLKEAWETFPDFREQYLRIESIAPKAVEVKKLVNASCEPDLQEFRDLLSRANRGPVGSVSVKIEK